MLSFISCSKKEKVEMIPTETIPVKTVIERFDQQFYTTPPEKLADLKKQFPYLFPEPNPDSVWVNKMKNKDEQSLFAETQKLYTDFNSEKEQLTSLFKHIKYYYPKFKEPKVITILTNVDYNNKVVLADSLLFISLDVFLGKESEIYQDFPEYIKQNYTKEHMMVSVAEEFSDVLLMPSKDKTFIARMIQEGKKLQMIQAFLPKVAANEIIGYAPEDMTWAADNEEDIWKYFVENTLFYNTDTQLNSRFIEDAPFSKFYLEFDKNSPGRIGSWFGWQIVQSYLKNNEVTLQEMLLTNNEEIFKKSKYKPKKKG
jgi:gliding motility-associated lipoprotein GldB